MAKAVTNSRMLVISLLLRITMVVQFGGAGIRKWIEGYGPFIKWVQELFAPSGFPHWLATTWGAAIPFIEVLLAVWFLVGWKLKGAWMVLGLFMVTLAFGLFVVGNNVGAMVNYLYVFFAVIGLTCCYADNKHA